MLDIHEIRITVGEVYSGYSDRGDDGVTAYDGRLDIRPAYQRELVYNQQQQEAVIDTVLHGYPLNTMYWATTGRTDGPEFEVLDGQQRTLSLMRFLDHQFAVTIDGAAYYADSLPQDRYEALMKYQLTVYVCTGVASEKLAWFRVVNIAGAKLTDQELRNAVYTGPWLSDAKRHFSRRNCPAYGLGGHYVKGDPIRQELLETALAWISDAQDTTIEVYMSAHQHDADADELWQYFQDVIAWVTKLFPKYYTDMKSVDWGRLYNKWHTHTYNAAELERQAAKLHADEEVQSSKGIYEYLLSRNETPFAAKLLHLRGFDEADKRRKYAEQDGRCALCHRQFNYDEMQGDHIVPWSKGGRTTYENLQMLCRECNAKKSDQY